MILFLKESFPKKSVLENTFDAVWGILNVPSRASDWSARSHKQIETTNKHKQIQTTTKHLHQHWMSFVTPLSPFIEEKKHNNIWNMKLQIRKGHRWKPQCSQMSYLARCRNCQSSLKTFSELQNWTMGTGKSSARTLQLDIFVTFRFLMWLCCFLLFRCGAR